MCLFTISKKKDDKKWVCGKSTLTGKSFSLLMCPPHYSFGSISWVSPSLVPGSVPSTRDAGPQHWGGGWAPAGMCEWLEHGCHSICGDHYYHWLLRNGTKFSAAKVRGQSLISLALGFVVFNICSLESVFSLLHTAQHINKSAPAEALSGPAPALGAYVGLGRPADFMAPESKGGSPGMGCDYSWSRYIISWASAQARLWPSFLVACAFLCHLQLHNQTFITKQTNQIRSAFKFAVAENLFMN